MGIYPQIRPNEDDPVEKEDTKIVQSELKDFVPICTDRLRIKLPIHPFAKNRKTWVIGLKVRKSTGEIQV